MVLFILLAFFFIHTTYAAGYCSQFNDCESCAGRHRITFELCVWCPSTSTCMSPKSGCKGELQEIFDCPRKMEVEYNETFVRDVVTTLIGASQGNYNQIQTCLSTLPGRVQLWKRFSVQSGEGDRSDAFVAVDYHSRAIIASFSSVASGSNLLYRSFSAEFFTNRQAQFEDSDGLVNRYIYDSWIKLWKVLGLEATLRKLFEFYSGFEFWVVGHAVGGSKADMTALAVVLKNMIDPQKIRLVTFGSTRVGDISFVEMIETKIPYRFRIVHNQDMIVKYPKPFEGEWTPPSHHRYEVWYPNDMDFGARFYICLGAEDPQCSSGLAPWEARPDDNDVYFQRNLRLWATHGCEDTDRIAARPQAKYFLLDHPQPKYNFAQLQTAKPYTTTEPPVSRLPGTNTTPKITKPPVTQADLRPHAVITATSRRPPTTTLTTVLQTLPWWFTTKPWSTTQPPTITKTARPPPEIKAIETKKKLKTPSQDKQDTWWIAPKDAKRDLSDFAVDKTNPNEKRPFLEQERLRRIKKEIPTLYQRFLLLNPRFEQALTTETQNGTSQDENVQLMDGPLLRNRQQQTQVQHREADSLKVSEESLANRKEEQKENRWPNRAQLLRVQQKYPQYLTRWKRLSIGMGRYMDSLTENPVKHKKLTTNEQLTLPLLSTNSQIVTSPTPFSTPLTLINTIISTPPTTMN